MSKTILLADDDSAIRTVLGHALTRAGYAVRSTATATSLWRWASEGQGDAVITDVVLPDENAFDLIPRIRKARPKLPIIVMSAQNTIMTAIRASELGAYDYLPKPFDLNVLLRTVARAVEQQTRNIQPKAAETSENLPIIGRSPAMQEIYRAIARLIQTDLTVMIQGESGTGKELVARALHDFGKRKRGPFIPINMAAIPRDMIESELFGHEKGAFPGALLRKAGKFEQAEGGTLFLDEIGDMPMEAQTRLLRVLQQGEFTTVGGASAITANSRIIAATHRDLRQLIAQGQFREDLFFRLNVVPLRLPPLRERLEDIPDLARHFLKLSTKDGLPLKDISPAALDALRLHSWAGNVRELENVVKRLVAITADDTIEAGAVAHELAKAEARHHATSSAESANLSDFVEAYLARSYADGKAALPNNLYHKIIDEVEPPLLRAALAAARGNQLKAAAILGINRNTLRSKIKHHKIVSLKGFT